MKSLQRKKVLKGICMTASMLSLLMMTSCGKTDNKIEEDYNNLSEIEENVVTGTSIIEDESKNEMETHFTYTTDDENAQGIFRINADVEAEGIGDASVYYQEIINVDQQFLKNLANGVFDGEEYTVKKPYAYMSKDELKTEAISIIENAVIDDDNEYGKQLKETTSNIDSYINSQYKDLDGYFDALTDIAYTYDYVGDKQSSDMPSDSIIVTVAPEEDNKVYFSGALVAWDVDFARISGKIDNKPYDIIYGQTNLEGNIIRELKLRYVGLHSDAVDYICHTKDDVLETMDENLCDYDHSVGIANDILKKMGLDDYVLEDSYDRVCQEEGDTGVSYLNGYRLFFAPSVGGIKGYVANEGQALMIEDDSFGVKNLQADLEGDETVSIKMEITANKFTSVNQSMISVEIDDNGLINVKIGELYKLGEKMSVDTELLSFNQIIELYKEHAKEVVMGDQMDAVDEIKLRYVTLKYEEGYILVPVWLFYAPDRSVAIAPSITDILPSSLTLPSSTKKVVVAVNALDGSSIQFTKQYIGQDVAN